MFACSRVARGHADRRTRYRSSDGAPVPGGRPTHKTPEIQAWLEKHPHFKLHFTPTSAAWLNLVERFFAKITSRRIRRGSYCSINNLEAAIYGHLY